MTEAPAPEQAEGSYTFAGFSKVDRLTALWALSESVLGGFLHAARIPFKGMLISCIAIVIISLLAHYSSKPKQILKATLIVVCIKAAVSPLTPLTAYLAVAVQGLLGSFFFLFKNARFVSCVLFGITVSVYNSVQKIIFFTIVFGETLWKTMNDIAAFIAEELFFIKIVNPIDISSWLIIVYVAIHVLAGFFTGVLSSRLPQVISNKENEINSIAPLMKISHERRILNRKNKIKRPYLKRAMILIITVAAILIILSYLYPESKKFEAVSLAVMIVRSIAIMLLWFFIVSPWVRTIFNKYMAKKNAAYASEMKSMTEVIPEISDMIGSVWEISAKHSGVKRLYYFLITTLAFLLSDR